MASPAEAFEPVDGLDRLVHDPARLTICTALLNCHSADFVFLRKVTGLTAGNLSFHLSRLEEARLVDLRRDLVGRVTRTEVSLTELGRQRVSAHWNTLQRLRDTAIERS
jgi:DNA-binding transcriptional ArsR family regulator